jgi:hypothetical protein
VKLALPKYQAPISSLLLSLPLSAVLIHFVVALPEFSNQVATTKACCLTLLLSGPDP